MSGFLYSSTSVSAIRALVHLAMRPPGTIVNTDQLTSTMGGGQCFAAKILQQLVHAHFLGSARGPRGGFWLIPTPGAISLADVVEAIEGPSLDYHQPANETWDPVSEALDQLRCAARSLLTSRTIADLAQASCTAPPYPVRSALQSWADRLGSLAAS